MKGRLIAVKTEELENIKKCESFASVVKDGDGVLAVEQDKPKEKLGEKEKEEDWYTSYKYFHHG